MPRLLTHLLSKLSFWIVVGAFFISLLVINDTSLWDDELIRIRCIKASFLENLNFSYTQLQPLFMSFMWCYEKLVGTGEFALKGFNAIFCAVAAAYFLLILRQEGRSPWYSLVPVLHPTVFYYNNEISPYIMLLAYSTASIYYLYYSPHRHTYRNIIILNILFLLAYALHFISGFYYIIIALSVLLADARAHNLTLAKKYGRIFLFFLPLFIGLTCLYLIYMKSGQNRGWDAPGINNIAYILYSFCGMQGLGLSRIDLRFFTWENLTTSKIFLLSFASVSSLCCALLCRKNIADNLRKQPYILPLCGYLLIFISVSIFVHFRFWERHLIFLLPFFLLFAIQAIDDSLRSQCSKLRIASFLAIVIILFISSLRIVVLDYYHKDDFKGVFAKYYSSPPRGIILCQCYGYSKKFYNIAYTSTRDFIHSSANPAQVVDISEVPFPLVMQCIHKAANESQTVRMVLNKRAEWVPTLYQDAECILRRHGYEIHAKHHHNIFLIIDFSKKHTAPHTPSVVKT